MYPASHVSSNQHDTKQTSHGPLQSHLDRDRSKTDPLKFVLILQETGRLLLPITRQLFRLGIVCHVAICYFFSGGWEICNVHLAVEIERDDEAVWNGRL
jgi:hypothetical protein